MKDMKDIKEAIEDLEALGDWKNLGFSEKEPEEWFVIPQSAYEKWKDKYLS